MAKLRAGEKSKARRVIAPRRANPRGAKPVPMKQPPEEWLSPARYQIKVAKAAVKDEQYRIAWQSAYESVEKTIKAAAPFRTRKLGPAYARTHALVRPLVNLRKRYPGITDSMMDEARWMEEDIGYQAKCPNGKPIGEHHVLRAIELAERLAAIIGEDPRRGLEEA